MARALDRAGLAASHHRGSVGDDSDGGNVPPLNWALSALSEAFRIRLDVLGPTNPDTADTLNGLAGLYLRRGELSEAVGAYTG